MARLKLRSRSRIGVPDYSPGSEEEGKYFVIVIATEGCKEEIVYLKWVRELCKEKSSKNVTVEIVNEEYADEKVAVSDSHPIKRLGILLERMGHTNPSYKDYPTDEAWLVSDRDDGSFTEKQYEEVRQTCNEKGIHWVVSNPAFQLWLLFHFTDSLEDLKLESYSKSSDKKERIEKELKKYVKYYQHGSLNILEFEGRIEDAVVNSSCCCTDVAGLKCNIGTNFASLIQSLKEKFEIEEICC